MCCLLYRDDVGINNVMLYTVNALLLGLFPCTCCTTHVLFNYLHTAYYSITTHLSQILQWSYPYAYFEFENDDYNDYSRYVLCVCISFVFAI